MLNDVPFLRRLDCLITAGIRPVGGGTAPMLMMKAAAFTPVRLVSLRHVHGPFTGMSLSDDGAYFQVYILLPCSDAP
jgi:hypothetical protein